MPTEVKGALALRKALKDFAPDLAKETQKELGNLLKPITNKARGFIPSRAPLSGWNRTSETAWGTARIWSTGKAKRGIGYKTTPSKPNKQGFRALARIANMSVAGEFMRLLVARIPMVASKLLWLELCEKANLTTAR